jgi:hypothetical protein
MFNKFIKLAVVVLAVVSVVQCQAGFGGLEPDPKQVIGSFLTETLADTGLMVVNSWLTEKPHDAALTQFCFAQLLNSKYYMTRENQGQFWADLNQDFLVRDLPRDIISEYLIFYALTKSANLSISVNSLVGTTEGLWISKKEIGYIDDAVKFWQDGNAQEAVNKFGDALGSISDFYFDVKKRIWISRMNIYLAKNDFVNVNKDFSDLFAAAGKKYKKKMDRFYSFLSPNEAVVLSACAVVCKQEEVAKKIFDAQSVLKKSATLRTMILGKGAVQK